MIQYRKSLPHEIDSIMDLVVRTFTGEQGIPKDLNYLPSDKNPRWYCAVDNGKVIGSIAFFQESDGWHAGRFAIEPSYRGHHIGTELLIYAFRDMLSSVADEIIMEGRPATVHILTGLGAEVTGKPFPFYKSTCTPLRITKEAFQTDSKKREDYSQ